MSSVFGLLQKMSQLDWQSSREHECSKMDYPVMTGFGVQGVQKLKTTKYYEVMSANVQTKILVDYIATVAMLLYFHENVFLL